MDGANAEFKQRRGELFKASGKVALQLQSLWGIPMGNPYGESLLQL